MNSPLKQKLMMLKGLQASGKSTFAKELVAEGWKRVNKDDLRAMIDNSKWTRGNEKAIREAQKVLATIYLQKGYNVVVDDTNFAYEDYWKEFAENNGAEFELKFFNTPLLECIERDANRGDKTVGAKVILETYNRYLKPSLVAKNTELRDCYIFDIDGTLAKMNGRSPYDYSKVLTDLPNRDVVNLAKHLYDSTYIIIVSGRDGSCSYETQKWLYDNGITYENIYMRPAGDSRSDTIIKTEIYENEIKGKYNVLGVFDDRDRVVQTWRSLGLTCFQVDYGNF